MKTYREFEDTVRKLADHYNFNIIPSNPKKSLKIYDRKGFLVKEVYIYPDERTMSDQEFRLGLRKIIEHGKLDSGSST